jgi:hypothetical protein
MADVAWVRCCVRSMNALKALSLLGIAMSWGAMGLQ